MANAPVVRRLRVAPVLPMLARTTLLDVLKVVRLPGLVIAAAVLPVILFTFLGLPHVHERVGGREEGPMVLVAYATFSTTNVMLIVFGLGLSMERGLRLDVLLRASPMPAAVYLAAKVLTAAALALLSLVVLFAYAALVGRVLLAPGTAAEIVGLQLLGSLPFIAMGFSLAYLLDPAAANAVINLVYLLLGFLSGLLIPLRDLPGFLQHVAPVLPTYRFAQLSDSGLGAASDPALTSLVWLLGYAVVFFGVALWAHQLEERRSFS